MLDVPSLRRQFPGLQQQRDGRVPIFFDGPGGTQVPQRVVDAIVHYLKTCNANHGGGFATSDESDAVVLEAHRAMADLLHAPSHQEVIFGANMTTLTFALSRAFGKTLRAGDEVLVSRMDHDGNVTPWVLAARDAGAVVKYIDVRPEDCTLDMDSFRKQLSARTRLVAVGRASNAVGTINDVHTITRLAHDAGARVFIDAVHYTPHGPIDVQDWGCDFLACSAYKFFGPHIGVLWARRELLQELPAYKLRPVPESLPDRWMTGTQNHECLAGVAAAVDYLAELSPAPQVLPGRAGKLRAALTSIQGYERQLGSRLLDALAARPRFKVWGITNREQLSQRVPTIAMTCNRTPEQTARYLASQQIYVWHGNMYAIELTERLGLEKTGGVLRVGMVHYNTAEEIDRFVEALDRLP